MCDFTRENVPKVSVGTAERTASELAYEPTQSEGEK